MSRLTRDPLQPGRLLDLVADPGHGGTATFVGTTRLDPGDAVEALVYEAYEEMAEAELARIEAEAAARFGARVAVAHRLGRVEVGQASVAVAASAPHRGDAFAACRYAIDELKAHAPIWKREVRPGGAATWRDGVEGPGG